MNRPSAITPHEKRLPESGNVALVAALWSESSLASNSFSPGSAKS